MPADEVTHGADVEASRARTGPRHAAPKKPLFTRFHMPAGKAIAIAAMPTAVLMGMGFTPTLAQADDQPSSRNLTADEFKECLEAIEKAEEGDASASPTPSATASESASEDAEEPSADPTGSAPAQEAPDADEDADKGSDSSPDSGSDDETEPTPTPSATAGGQAADTEPAPSPSETDKNLLEQIGDAIEDVFTPGEKAEETPSPSPSASASSSAPAEETDEKAEEAPQKPAEKAAGDVLEQTGDAVQDATEQAEEAVEEETQEPEATASPSPSESSGIDLEDCPVATDAEGGVDNNVPLPDDPWFLNASSLLLKGADYKGIVEVRTANGTKKKVLKYVISDGTDIGDLHQTVKDPQTGKTYHVQAAKGSTSTIRDGDTVMYTESISGNLLGLIPVTFDPENPPPLNIPLIYFTKVTVQQAGQFGGTLHVPGLHQYVTD
ncbi:hypothetical protein [Streptomyces albogriseolus]|uniref:Uncharacterized protein n=1 Tax=Streptomyces albogriseolus TaxID=1887 RepID=A0ACC6UT19_STRAO|nr:hypothetical protein [Streptomyces viridodiastaticus]GHG26750.1 hypothetical protein GCM10018777_47470 [Streptomyces viridodiastaticus]